MDKKIIKQVVKSLNEDLRSKYIHYDYDDIEKRDYFKATSYDDEGFQGWSITISDVGLYSEGDAIDSAPDYDIDKDPFNALKQHVIAHYNAYLRELAL